MSGRVMVARVIVALMATLVFLAIGAAWLAR